ncbi:MAG TPA: hypothetical protein VE733_04680 [Streptosporangiaceae bacterium]|jgi:hypothetical protein|nr:hypothetical protein [Streptosporangiaceae bacterium]
MGLKSMAACAATAALVTAGLAIAPTALAAPARPAAPKPAATAGAPYLTWGKPVHLAGNGYGDLKAVSCPSATDCLAIDTGGDAVTWNGRRWSAPAAAIRGAAGLASLSCPSTTFCAAAGNSLWIGHGTRWIRSGPPPGRYVWDAVSCTSATFCTAATIDGYVSKYDGRAWSAPVRIDSDAPGSMTVSCASATRCFAMDGYGAVYRWNGTTWTSITGFDKYASLACAPGKFCMVLDDETVYTFNGSSWSPSGNGPLAMNAYLSCASATFCMALNPSGTADLYNGKAWRQFPKPVFTTHAGSYVPFAGALACSRGVCAAVSTAPASAANVYRAGAWGGQVTVDNSGELDSVSCPASGFCAATGMSDYAVIRRGGHWGGAVTLPRAQEITSVSCPSATFCLAADVAGHAWRYTGTRWVNAPAPVLSLGYQTRVSEVSCVSPRFCAWAGYGLTVFNGTRWTPFAQAYGDWTAVGCASAAFCVAGDVSGEVSVFNGNGWSAPVQMTPGFPGIAAISCPSARFCVAVDSSGGVGTFNGATWAYAKIAASSLTGVSCTSSRFCVAVDETGRAYTFNGTQWSKPVATHLRPNAIQEGVSCASATFCVAVDSLGDTVTGT